MSLDTTVYKVIAILVFVVYAIQISDFRNHRATPLINQTFLTLLKILYPIAPIIYVYTIISIQKLTIWDYFGLMIICCGTLVVVLAKRELGEYHSWAGQFTDGERFVSKGIYSFIRHPMYLGIFIAVVGTFFSLISHLNYPLLTIYFIETILIFNFLIISKRKEEQKLEERFGKKYKVYKDNVSSFFPRKKNTY